MVIKEEEEKPLIKPLSPLCDVTFKRQFRWTFEMKLSDYPLFGTDFVKSISGLRMSYDPVSKGMKWEPLVVTYYEVIDKKVRSLESMYAYINDASNGGLSKAVAKLNFYNGTGDVLDYWEFELEFVGVDFGNFSYSSSDECNIAMKFNIRTAKHHFAKNDGSA